MPPDLPSFRDFKESLVCITEIFLPDDEVCAICKQPYRDALTQFLEVLDMSSLSLLKQLPFHLHHNIDFDDPVRLPCTHGHVFGIQCLQEWWAANNSNQCLLCMEPLFQRTPEELHARNKTARVKYSIGARKITSLSLRKLIMDHKIWTPEHRIRIEHPHTHNFELIRMMTEVAMRFNRPHITCYENMEGAMRFQDRNDPLDTFYPEEVVEDGDVLRRMIGTSQYRFEITAMSRAFPLCGVHRKYPDFLNLLLSSQAEIMHVTLVKAIPLAPDDLLAPADWADYLKTNVQRAWGKSYDGERIALLLDLTVKAWLARERMMTELNEQYDEHVQQMGMDIDQDAFEGEWSDDEEV